MMWTARLTKYEELAERIKRRVDSGEYESGQAIPSIRALMSAEGLSMGTVVKGLDLLAEHGVLNHLAQRGYVVAGRDDHTARIGHIAFITPWLSGDTNLSVRGLAGSLDSAKYTLSTFSAQADLKRYQESIEAVAKLRPTGVVLTTMPKEVCRIDLAPLLEAGIPVVALERHVPELVCDRVVHSRRDGARKVAAHMLKHGLQDPTLLISAPRRDKEEMIETLRRELGEAGIDIPDARIFLFSPEHGYTSPPDPYVDAERRIAEIIGEGWRSGTLICDHDFPAVGALRAVLSAGLSVPEDVRIISAERCVVNTVSPMALTTVDCHGEEQARLAAELLVRRIEGHTGPPEIHYVAGDLIEGETG